VSKAADPIDGEQRARLGANAGDGAAARGYRPRSNALLRSAAFASRVDRGAAFVELQAPVRVTSAKSAFRIVSLLPNGTEVTNDAAFWIVPLSFGPLSARDPRTASNDGLVRPV
jgi:hypothetical protein